ncbi:MAG TPA: DUF4173 domain-containing protein [Thermoleophilaceae bacterium]
MSSTGPAPERPGGAPDGPWAPPSPASRVAGPGPPVGPGSAPGAVGPGFGPGAVGPGSGPNPLARRAALAAVGAGALGAALLPGASIGLNVVLVAAAVAVVAALSGRAPRGGWRLAWAGLALALALAALVRDAAWVVLPSLGGSVLLGSLAMAGGSTWPAVGRGLVGALARLHLGPAVVARSAADALPGDAGARAGVVLRGLAIAAPLVIVFGSLFASSDPAFAHLADDALPSIDDLGPLRVRGMWFVAVLALAAAVATAGGSARAPASRPARRLRPVEWAIALVALDALFAAFVGVQAAVLFGRDEHVLRTAGLTYAEYAREGFGQLLAAAALTLAVVAGALRWARAETTAQRRLLRSLLVVLCALTVVVLASALHRLDLYQDAFGATRLRLAADATMLALAAVLGLLVAAIASGRHAWLPRACVLVAAAGLLAFAASNPDRRIAERNVDRYALTGRLDTAYLRQLSADAVPAVARLPAGVREEALRKVADDGWSELNLGRARARRARRRAGR